MKKVKQGLVFLICFLILTPTVFADSARQTLGELKAEYQKKLDEKKENDNKTAEAKADIAAKEQAIKKAEEDINKAIEEQRQVEANIEESNKRIETLTKETEKIIRYLQEMQGSNAYVEYVSGASTMTDFIMRVAAVEQVSDQVRVTMQQLEDEIARNEQLKKELIEKQEALKEQQEVLKKAIAARYNDIAGYDKYALDIDTQIKSLKTKLDSAEKNCAAYAPDKGDDAVISSDCVKKVYNSAGQVVTIENGEWLKPLTSGVITSEIGYRWGSYHNALDIGGNAEGTPVYAAAAGVVSGKIARYSCGGNMLYIDVTVNGQAYTTYYYHLLRFNVDVGDVVDQNTIIGYVGGTTTSTSYGGYDYCTTGAHLHFGVATGFYNGYSVPSSKVITPPGFPNSYGWRFYARNEMYAG